MHDTENLHENDRWFSYYIVPTVLGIHYEKGVYYNYYSRGDQNTLGTLLGPILMLSSNLKLLDDIKSSQLSIRVNDALLIRSCTHISKIVVVEWPVTVYIFPRVQSCKKLSFPCDL